MVTKVNGLPERGFWFSKDVKTLRIVATAGGDFVNDADGVNGVDSELEQVIEAIQTRATVIAVSIEAAGQLNVIVDYANAFTVGNSETTANSVEAELATAIDAIGDLATITVDTHDGFIASTSL